MPPNTPRRQLITIAAAADYLGCSTKTVRRYIAAGRLPAYRAGARFVRVDAAEVDALLRPIPVGAE